MSDQEMVARDTLRQRKIVGLLKLIQEKNQQIESLKHELKEASKPTPANGLFLSPRGHDNDNLSSSSSGGSSGRRSRVSDNIGGSNSGSSSSSDWHRDSMPDSGRLG